MAIEIVGDEEHFKLLKDAWQELLHDSDADSVFLTWDWLFTWWQHLAEDRKLFIVVVRRANRVIGIAPCVVRPPRWKRVLPFQAVEFLGTGEAGSDYLDVILRKGCEAEAAAAIAAEFQRLGLTLQLTNVREDSSTTTHLRAPLTAHGWAQTAVTMDKCPYIDLHNMQWDQYIASLGKSHRANVRRRLRKLQKLFAVSLCRVRQPEDCQAALGILIEHHLERLSARGGSTGFHTTRLVRFHEAFTQLALQRGWLRLFVLRLDERPAAAFYCLRYQHKYYYYQSGLNMEFSAYSAGLAGIAMLIDEAIAEGATELDFLHGEESYKYLWTHKDRTIVRVDAFQSGLGGSLCQRGMAARAWLRNKLASGSRQLPPANQQISSQQ